MKSTLSILQILCLVINLCLITSLNNYSYAQSTDGCWVTQVGNPPEDLEKPTCSNTGGGLPGQPLPSSDTQIIIKRLCDDYKVCPTTNTYSPPSEDWNIDYLTALWNVVQKIYESPTYTKHAIGNYTLEISRVNSHPADGGWAYGVNIHTRTPEYHMIPGSRLIVITDRVGTQSIPYLEWLFAHEIGHAASYGQPDGSIANDPGNFVYNTVIACGTTVSNYGIGSSDENYADAVSYYLTTGEEVTTYGGSAKKNIKDDFPCIYNALKQGYFDNNEY